MGASALRFCGRRRSGFGGVSNGEEPGGDERRKIGFSWRYRHHISFVNDCSADLAVGRGKAAEFYVLAARRSVAGDAKRVLSDFDCRGGRNNPLKFAGASL